MKAAPETSSRRVDRSVCPYCEATPGGCEGLHWLGRRWCCEACGGDHDKASR